MRQTGATDKIDPLTRIQEEIKEVVRREEEYRQLTAGTPLVEFDEHDNNNSLSLSADGMASAAVAVVTSLTLQDDNMSSNTPSLALSVDSKESLDEQHSDDSGISASSSPVNGLSANGNANNNNNNNTEPVKTPTTPGGGKEQRYIGPNCYTLTPEPPQQKLLSMTMTRTVSTPHLAATGKPRQFAYNPAHKGVMQRFIASRGKLQLNNGAAGNTSPGVGGGGANTIMLNGRNAAALLNLNVSAATMAAMVTPPNTPSTAAGGNSLTLQMPDFGARMMAPAVATPPVIERDAEGRPIRPGYVPVELKIQRELKDLKTRESELKKIRKIRLSTTDLLDSIENENLETDDDDDDSEVEHCYGPGQLRCTKSIGELCDSAQSNSSISPRTTPSPDFDGKMNYQRGGNAGGVGGVGGMRPAISLAQLCDLTPEEAPSSHRLIAQWESLIQQNA